MGRLRSALAGVSVAAVFAAGFSVQADGAVPQTDAPAATNAGPTGPTGETGPTGNTGPTGDAGGIKSGDKPGGNKPHKNKGKKKQTTDPASPDAPKPTGAGHQSGGKITDVTPGTSAPLSVTDSPGSGLSDSGVSGDSSPIAACDGTAGPPKNLVPIYIAASQKYSLGSRGPAMLAAINKIETDFGRLNRVTSSAGAIGWMQFMPATWSDYATDGDGDGKTDPYNAADAIHAAARYLQAAGAPDNWYDAIWAYNHADWYVQDVMDKAACFGTMSGTNTKPVDTSITQFNCVVSDRRRFEVPGNYLNAFEDAASRYELGERGVWSLAAVARLESDYGRGMNAKQLAATGPMGLSKAEWAKYGVDGDEDGLVNRDNVEDSVSTFARMMWASGGIKPGLFAHNHAAWYVQITMQEADRIAGKCSTDDTDWSIAFPTNSAATNNEINWGNLTILNPAAQNDIQDGLIDPRVLHLLAILTQRYTLTVSALRSDHGMMTASGNVSNHYFGRAMDIASVNGVSCTDMSPTAPCSEVGRLLTMLPDGIKPTELIYGYDLDGPGPAFALPDHRNHLHVGFYAN